MPFIITWVDQPKIATETVCVATPFSPLSLVTVGDVVVATDWLSDDDLDAADGFPALAQYWLEPTANIPITLKSCGTLHQQRIWRAMCEIPFGCTVTYGALAKRLGSNPRVVGNACRANPFPLLVPCHRVVGASCSGGYCGHTEGSWWVLKQQLLAFEQRCF